MLTKNEALPLGVKIIALLFVVVGEICNYFIDARSSSNKSHLSSLITPNANHTPPNVAAGFGLVGADNSSKVLAELEAQYNVLQRRHIWCAAQEQQMNPWNFGTLPCEPQMARDIAQMAKLEAKIYRLKTGASVHTSDVALGIRFAVGRRSKLL